MGVGAIAQCDPDQQYADETYGFWPADLAVGQVDINYGQTITLKAPVNGGEINAAFAAYDIDSLKITSIEGLPEGYTYTCLDPDCSMLGGDLSCVVLSGVTNEPGQYPLIVNINLYATVASIGIEVPTAYTEFTLVVEGTDNIDELNSSNFVLNQNAPNPFSNFTMIPFEIKDAGQASIEVYNLLGEQVFAASDFYAAGEHQLRLDAEEFQSGVYFYRLEVDGQVQTRRMLVNK